MKRTEGQLLAQGIRLAVLHTRWNHLVVDRLLEGAETAFRQLGGQTDHLEAFAVPGSFELPLVARKLAQSGRFDAVVCLGAVIRGATDHYEFVASNAASGLASVGHDTGIPILFGVLTTDTLEQALERSGSKAGNKGFEAVCAAIETVNLLKALGATPQVVG
jgi:6,7-dimethyl-8-ribityllumazine synthase